ncbi:hypothetical protein [Neorhizobium sp. NCHU2750]|uniref:hypothetical protein n=1 Tax=Neorhizobium sp. NCHU2750 TaxID=1825976 RepID=UPI000EB6D693|nr:hypothetical protein NCHU2750_06370 [Neorhizobium sp. NCHU2750]
MVDITAAEVWDDYVSSGIPSSGKKKPKKSEIRKWGAWVESIIGAFTSNGGLIYTSLTTLNADLAHDANTMAWVIDGTTSGIYMKVGASGTGSWLRVSNLPFSFIIGSDVGSGTANAILITTDVPVSDGAIIAFSLARSTTSSPVTVSINSGSILTIKSNRGSDVSGLSAGMEVWGRIHSSDSTFRLISDQDVSLLIDQAKAELIDAAEDIRDQAAASATAAAASATQAQTYAEMVGAAVYDFNFDSDPETPGYDWNEE